MVWDHVETMAALHRVQVLLWEIRHVEEPRRVETALMLCTSVFSRALHIASDGRQFYVFQPDP